MDKTIKQLIESIEELIDAKSDELHNCDLHSAARLVQARENLTELMIDLWTKKTQEQR